MRDVAGDADEKRKGVLGGGDRVSAGGVHHDHATARGGIHIHIVHAHTGTADDAELRGGVEHGSGDFRLTADDESGKFGDDFDEFGFGQAGVHNDLKGAAVGEFINAALGNRIGHEDLGFGRGHFRNEMVRFV